MMLGCEIRIRFSLLFRRRTECQKENGMIRRQSLDELHANLPLTSVQNPLAAEGSAREPNQARKPPQRLLDG